MVFGLCTHEKFIIIYHPELCSVVLACSGGNSLFPVGERSLLNFRQNFQISDNPPPHLHSKRLFLALLLVKISENSSLSTKVGGGGKALPPPPPHQDFRHCLLAVILFDWSKTQCWHIHAYKL